MRRRQNACPSRSVPGSPTCWPTPTA